MSFSVSMGNGAYEYAGSGLAQIVGQAEQSAEPWPLAADPRHSPLLQDQPGEAALPLRGHDHRPIPEGRRLFDFFLERHLLPMAGAIWSAAPGDMRDYPAKAFLKFFNNHGLLKITNRPLWRTVKGARANMSLASSAAASFETRLRTPVGRDPAHRGWRRSSVRVERRGAEL